MWKHEAPGLLADVVIILSILLIGGGVMVFGYQCVDFFRQSNNWTNINMSDVFDQLDVSPNNFLWGYFHSVTELIWNTPVSIALIVVGVLVPFTYGVVSDAWDNLKEKRKERAKKKALRKAG